MYHPLNSDLYKLSMQHAVINRFPRAQARYSFFNRGGTKFPDHMLYRLERELLKFTEEAQGIEESVAMWLGRTCPFLPAPYIDFLSNYKFDLDELEINIKDGELSIEIEGPWYRTILWEVPLMAMISEVYYAETEAVPNKDVTNTVKNRSKGRRLEFMGAKYSDFGTRRRFSCANHMNVLEDLKASSPKFLVGTSNVLFAY